MTARDKSGKLENDNLWGFIHIFKIEEALWGNWQQFDTISFHCNERTTFN